jgi:hypothetical protein
MTTKIIFASLCKSVEVDESQRPKPMGIYHQLCPQVFPYSHKLIVFAEVSGPPNSQSTLVLSAKLPDRAPEKMMEFTPKFDAQGVALLGVECKKMTYQNPGKYLFYIGVPEQESYVLSLDLQLDETLSERGNASLGDRQGTSPTSRRNELVSNDDILACLRRIYAAIGLSTQKDLSSISIVPAEGLDGVRTDFQGKLTDDEMNVLIRTSLHQIASFKDPCKTWFGKNGQDSNLVEDCVNSSRELAIIVDLDNFLKHGEDKPGKLGRTGLFPALLGIRRVMQTKAMPGTRASVSMDSTGLTAAGDVSLVLFAQVVNRKTGDVLGVLPMMQQMAVRAWEDLLKYHGFLE